MNESKKIKIKIKSVRTKITRKAHFKKLVIINPKPIRSMTTTSNKGIN